MTTSTETMTYDRAHELFTVWIEENNYIDHISGDSAYAADDHPLDYQTGEFGRTSYHLQHPTDTPMMYAPNGNGSICHDPNGDPLGVYAILEITERYVPCPDDDRCGDDGECESHCIQEPMYWDWELHALEEPADVILYYASNGCLPDSGPQYLELEEAREIVAQEWQDIAQYCPEWTVDSLGDLTEAALEAVDAIERLSVGAYVSDPRPGSLYGWTLSPAPKNQ